jgi:hypothetical protein
MCDTRCVECTPECRGNWALFDIINALTNLRMLLPTLGGDPNAVTLLGWKSGAALVNLLMSSPLSAPRENTHTEYASVCAHCRARRSSFPPCNTHRWLSVVPVGNGR